ncbi:MAG: hypothetical protein U1F45_16265 [Burkholderiales bacterium]
MQTVGFEPGGYRYIPAVFQYSGGVVAEPGFSIERARFPRLVPLAAGFRAIAAHLESLGRPLTAFCACELRSPAPFTEAGFVAFNRAYVGPLTEWGLFRADVNPVARSNVCPAHDAPAEPSFYAFSYTVPTRTDAPPSFVLSGCADSPEGVPSYRDQIVRRGETSPDALVEKAHFVLDQLEERLSAVGASWVQVTNTHLYTVFDAYPVFAAEFLRRGAIPGGLTWHFCRPPVVEIDFEMDARRVARQLVLD